MNAMTSTNSTPATENALASDDEGLNSFLFWVNDMGPSSLRRVANGIEGISNQPSSLAKASLLRGRADRLEAAGVIEGWRYESR